MSKKSTNSIIVILIAAAIAYFQHQSPTENGTAATRVDAPVTGNNDVAEEIAAAARQGRSGLIFTVSGTVIKTLPDDLEGSRHQRFIIELSNRHTLLVAHNIDLAPKVPLSEGDLVSLKGQFESNDRGGVMHWTHHDPNGRRDGGWIRHQGQVYQ